MFTDQYFLDFYLTLKFSDLMFWIELIGYYEYLNLLKFKSSVKYFRFMYDYEMISVTPQNLNQ